MKRTLFVLGILTLSITCLSACGQKKAQEPQKPQTAAPVAQAPAPKTETAPAVVAQPKPAAQPVVEAPKPVAIKEVIVADFNSGKKPNNIGGDFGAWNKDPDDPTQWCRESFNADERYGKEGYALQLDYDVDSPNPAYNGFWMKLENFNATPFNKLIFYVKGDAKEGYPARFKIELKNANGEVGKYYVTQISPTWAPVEVPFSSFEGIKDFGRLTEFTVVFEDSKTRPKTGRIYLDNIGFAGD